MAITITKEPTDFYPAFNQSYIQFNTDFQINNQANIKIDNTYNFTIYPSPNGQYLFNLKHIVSSLINGNKFRDNVDLSSAWGISDGSLYLSVPVEITAFSDSSSETLNKTYTFYKGVKQVGDREFNNANQILLPSDDGLNFYVKYFEGFPLDFTLRYISSGDTVQIRNKNTEETTTLTATEDNPYRIVLDNGEFNLNTSNRLSIPDLENILEIKVNGALKNKLTLKKESLRDGTYLKWFNSDGSYSYWLFNRFYKDEYAASEVDRLGTNNFNNIYGQTQGNTAISGKELERGRSLKTQVNEVEFNHLKSLISSPLVQMWNTNNPYEISDWIDVKVISRKISNNSKRHVKQVDIEIELPEQNTQFI